MNFITCTSRLSELIAIRVDAIVSIRQEETGETTIECNIGNQPRTYVVMEQASDVMCSLVDGCGANMVEV